MKIKSITYLVSILVGLFIIVTACKKDNESPTITRYAPAENSWKKWGDEVLVNAIFNDDVALESYTVNIGDENGNYLPAFDFMDSGEISGDAHNYSGYFTVPEDAPNMAWAYFTLKDAKGNTTVDRITLFIEE